MRVCQSDGQWSGVSTSCQCMLCTFLLLVIVKAIMFVLAMTIEMVLMENKKGADNETVINAATNTCNVVTVINNYKIIWIVRVF